MKKSESLSVETVLSGDGTIVLKNQYLIEQVLALDVSRKQGRIGSGDKPRKIPVRDFRRDLPAYLFMGIFSVLAVMFLVILRLDWAKVANRLPKLGQVFYEMSRFSTERFHLTILSLTETITVSLLALIYGMLIGLVMGALAAKNISPWQPLSVALKCFFAFIRAVPTPVWVLLVLASMGFGMASGIIGLGFHVAGFFGKVFAQIFEEVPDETVEALKATGAGKIQIFFGAILPSSLSGIIAWTALR